MFDLRPIESIRIVFKLCEAVVV